jgi:transposase
VPGRSYIVKLGAELWRSKFSSRYLNLTILNGFFRSLLMRSDRAVRTEVLPKRWIVEWTFAWFNRCRRLAMDFENLTRSALAFIQLASIRLERLTAHP